MIVARRALHYLPALAVVVAYGYAVQQGHDPLHGLTSSTKANAYQTLVGASGALLGFGLTSFAILFAVAPRSRLAAIVAHHGDRLRHFLTGALIMLAVATLGFTALLPIDDGGEDHWGRYVALGLFAGTVIAAGELIWLASQFFRVLSAQALEEEEEERSPVTDWTPPAVTDESFQMPTGPLPERPQRRRRSAAP